MNAPPIDKRKRADVIAETEALTQTYSGWQPPPDGAPDAGRALIRLFGRFAEIVIARLNRATEKNFLAFLNLLGTELLPPQPARVPLTFQLAANSPVDAAVPAGTHAAAPPLEGEEDEVIFETDRDLVVTRAQLQAVLVHDIDTDRYSDRTAQARGDKDAPYAVFEGDRPVGHELYFTCDEVLAKEGEKTISVIISSPDAWQWTTWPLRWAYWDEKAWRSLAEADVTPPKLARTGQFEFELKKLPEAKPSPVNGVEAAWLKMRLMLPLPPAKSDQLPDSIAVGDTDPRDLSLPIAPFGESAGAALLFYVSAEQAFGAGGALVRLRVKFSRRGLATGLGLKWSFQQPKDVQEAKDVYVWTELGQSAPGATSKGEARYAFSDGTEAFTKDGEIIFRAPLGWERLLYRTRTGRWLRVEITAGQYATPPQLASLTASYEWQLPRITGIRLKQTTAAAPLLPDLAYVNGSPIDLSKDFYPFGEQPRYNDALYLACETALARPGKTVKFTLTLTNPAGAASPPVKVVKADGNPIVAWETWNGSAWVKLDPLASGAKPGPQHTLTGTGDISLPLPASMAAVTVNGVEKYWLRARLVGGNYGEAARYTPGTITVSGTAIPSYTPVDATYAPPLVQSIKFEDPTGGAAEFPVSRCLSNNAEAYLDHAAALKSGAGFEPFRPTAETARALYLGFDQPFEPRPMTLYLQVEPPEPHEVAAAELAELDPGALARVACEYSAAAGWKPLSVLDATETLARRDMVQYIGPYDFVRRPFFGQDLYWLRAIWVSGEFPLVPRLRKVLLNTTWATQVTTSRDENLGSGNGNAGQVFRTARSPVLPGHVLEVRETDLPTDAERAVLEALEGPEAVQVTLDAAGQPEEIWVRWRAVADFYDSGPRDRHYTLDALSGEIRFGDGHHGMVPPLGQNNLRVTYRTGGGGAGNRAAGTIVQLKSTVPFVDGVTNHEASGGGTEREPIDRVAERGPRWLRHGNRSVTAQDLEDLAFAADRDVARASAIVPSFHPNDLWLDPKDAKPNLSKHEQVDAGRSGLIIVPQSTANRPTPSLSLLRRVQAYVAARASVAADLWVAGPEWVEVTVKVTVVPTSLDAADTVRERIGAALAAFIHPLTGGPDATGWTFGRRPHGSDLYAVVEDVPGVEHVRTMSVSNKPEFIVKRIEDELLRNALDNHLNKPLTEIFGKSLDFAVQRWLSRSLVYSGPHEILINLERG
jgi:hypothetical protein